MKVLIVKNSSIKNSDIISKKFEDKLTKNKIKFVDIDILFLNDENNFKTIKDKYDFIITFGGDGTIISATKIANYLDAPIMGINLGHVGFLTTITEKDNFDEIIKLLISKKFIVDKRSLLKGEVYRKDKLIYSSISLNDITLASSLYSKMGKYDLYLDEYLFNEYRSDGIIISSVTGATGHTLSAGGPIVSNKVPAFIITAICPHAINQRSLVVSDTTEIGVKIKKDGQICDFDGKEQVDLFNNDFVKIRKFNKMIRFIHFDNNYLYNSIKNKIKMF